MTMFLLILSVGLTIALVVYVQKCRQLVRLAAQSTKLAEQVRLQCEADTQSAIRSAQESVDNAQKLVDEQIASLKTEAERIRQHYEQEARKAQEECRTVSEQALKDLEGLRKYDSLRITEAEIQRVLSEAMAEAAALKAEAKGLLDEARNAASQERLKATERAKDIYAEADARLNQATRDAGQLIAAAEARAKEVGGEAFEALRDKQLLAAAAAAMRNVVEGYGDRYLIPTHSLLDDLSAEFGYTSAGESLKSAREQSRRMVEQGEAAACDYVEASRRATAVRFVIDAFNGRVDAILSRAKDDNYGTLEQEIRDTFSLVNLNGRAFRDAHILPAYLDARLAELKWAVVVQELVRKQREEQRFLKERMRDEEKARKEYETRMRQAAKEEELKRKAVEEKERELSAARQAFEQASAEEKAVWEKRVAELHQANQGLQQELAAATERKLTIAQQTKKGHVYVISNVGSFGEGVYKIGQTRRPDKQERIDELGDASVPFDFDVHAWLESENAPALEHKLHRLFLTRQVNKINFRREFFRVSLKEIHDEVDKLRQGEEFTVKLWTDVAAATEFRESLDVESNPQKLEKWRARQDALCDRQLRLDALRISPGDLADSGQQATAP